MCTYIIQSNYSILLLSLVTYQVGAGVGSLVGLLVGDGVGEVGARVRLALVGSYV